MHRFNPFSARKECKRSLWVVWDATWEASDRIEEDTIGATDPCVPAEMSSNVEDDQFEIIHAALDAIELELADKDLTALMNDASDYYKHVVAQAIETPRRRPNLRPVGTLDELLEQSLDRAMKAHRD